MPLQFLADSDIALTCLEAVDGADIVQATTGNKAARRSIGTSHHPAGSEGDGMNLGKRGREVDYLSL